MDDWLFLRLPYRQKYLGLRSHLKLSLMYFVPFRSFKGFLWILDPSSLSSINLMPKLGKLHTTPLSTYPQVNKEGDLSPEPKEILQRTVTKLGNKVAIEVLVNSRHSCRLCYMRVIPYLATPIPSPCGQGAFQREGYLGSLVRALCYACQATPTHMSCASKSTTKIMCVSMWK